MWSLFSIAGSSLPSTCVRSFFFFFNDTATTEIYTLSLHDALPISHCGWKGGRQMSSWVAYACVGAGGMGGDDATADRKSTRLNSSHSQISYAVFCLKKKKKTKSGYGIQSGICISIPVSDVGREIR